MGTIESWIGTGRQATQKFRYDQIGRLKESAEYRGDNGNLTYKQVFDFDRFGNMYRKAASNPTAGQQNPLAYTTIEETTTPGTGDIDKATNRFRTGTTYDDAKQVVTDNKFRSMSFAYDANGRQVTASRAGVADAWTVYDAAGNRLATKIEGVWRYMVYDAFGKLVAEYGQASEGLGGVKYIQQDWQGSVRTVTNANGFVVSRTDHQAFGGDVGYGVGQRTLEKGYNRDPATRQGYGLTERDDATGLDHTWFRKNESSAGRWTSPDPYKGSMSLANPQSFNRYSYVGSDPVNFVDPSGLQMAAVQSCRNVLRVAYTDGQFDSAWWEQVCEVRYEWVDDVELGGGGGGGGGPKVGNNLKPDVKQCRKQKERECEQKGRDYFNDHFYEALFGFPAAAAIVTGGFAGFKKLGWKVASKLIGETIITKAGPYVAVVGAAIEIRALAHAGLAIENECKSHIAKECGE